MELPEPPYGCPDTPGRECMLRHLYAKRHSHAVACATCSPMAAKVAAAKDARAQAKGMISRMLRAERQRKYEEIRKERRKAKTPEQIEAAQRMKLEYARRKEARRQAENEAKRVARALEKAARLAAMTQEEKDAMEQAKLDQRRANLDKARVAMLAKREAEKAAKLIRHPRRGNQNRLSLLEATCMT